MLSRSSSKPRPYRLLPLVVMVAMAGPGLLLAWAPVSAQDLHYSWCADGYSYSSSNTVRRLEAQLQSCLYINELTINIDVSGPQGYMHHFYTGPGVEWPGKSWTVDLPTVAGTYTLSFRELMHWNDGTTTLGGVDIPIAVSVAATPGPTVIPATTVAPTPRPTGAPTPRPTVGPTPHSSSAPTPSAVPRVAPSTAPSASPAPTDRTARLRSATVVASGMPSETAVPSPTAKAAMAWAPSSSTAPAPLDAGRSTSSFDLIPLLGLGLLGLTALILAVVWFRRWRRLEPPDGLQNP